MRRARRGSALLAAALLVGCGSAEVLPSERLAAAFSPRPGRGELSTISFDGDVDLDRRAGVDTSHGHVWVHLYYLDHRLFDAMACYAQPENCAVFDISRQDGGTSWVANLGFAEQADRPVVLHFDVGRAGSFGAARTLEMRVFLPPLGEIGHTRLVRARDADPREKVRARLRAQGRLQVAYGRIATRYLEATPREARLPAPHPEAPTPPPCGPRVVDDAQALEWLGLRPPAVVSWAYGLEVDEAAGTMQLTARRDPGCDGSYEVVLLRARRDDYGDLERLAPEDEPAPPGHHD